MGGAKGSALEWALALLHAPGERYVLRQQPLPEGMDRLLGIAAGAMLDDLAEAARAFNQSETHIREAAQFYAREVLFFPQADAYRVLGVAADASVAQIKAHHRLLQHWLHPDRLHNGDDAIFAARVNVAWNRLRNPERRQAYDATLREDPLPEALDGSGDLRSMRTWIPDPELPRSRWRHRLPMMALSVSCLLLVVLVMRDMRETEDGRERWQRALIEQPGNMPAAGVTAISMPRHAGPAVPAAAVASARNLAGSVRSSDDAVAYSPPVMLPEPLLAPALHTTALTLQGADEFESAAQATRLRVVQPPAPAMQASVASPVPAYTAPASVAPQRAVAHGPPASPGEVAPPARLAQPVSQSQASIAQDSNAQAVPRYARIQQAWAAGDQLLRYMGAESSPPPQIWNSPAIQSSASRLREDLHGGGGVRLSDSQWRIGNESAVLTSGYVVRGHDAGNGRLTADLVWREDRWLVIGLSIERVQ